MKVLPISISLFFYSLCHLVIDAASIALILGGIDVRSELLTFVILYNILAFGLQLPFGWLSDKLGIPVLFAFMGCIILSIALLVYKNALIATVLAGAGNALFHVGGGTISLNYKPKKAALPGVFVASGGIGLFLGGLFIKLHGFQPYILVTLLVKLAISLFLLKAPVIDYENKKTIKVNLVHLTIVFLLVTICIRSFVGLSLNFNWNSLPNMAIFLVISSALGKGLGGFLADYFEWIKIAVGGLAIAAILLFYANTSIFAGLIGIFLFNFTMAVTLVATSSLLPGRPGFAFGLTTFALLIGALPTFFQNSYYISDSFMSLGIILFSALLLFIALKLFFNLNRTLK
jgi:FSR family fosmidomycin resistance protein-like MFS transporter